MNTGSTARINKWKRLKYKGGMTNRMSQSRKAVQSPGMETHSLLREAW